MSTEEARKDRQPGIGIRNLGSAKRRTEIPNRPTPKRKATDPRHARVTPHHLPEQRRPRHAGPPPKPSAAPSDERHRNEPFL